MSPIDFFKRELAASHRRIVEAARNALKTTITTGVAAITQIAGPFGPLIAFRVGQPGAPFGLFEGAVAIAFAMAMQAAIVPVTGKLLVYPGLIMALLFVVFALIAYFLSHTRLFLIFVFVAVGTITTVYAGIFEPGEIGWQATYVFDGELVAILVMVVIDTLIWPSPAEQRLFESIAADFERTRDRLELVGRRYLDPFAPPLAAPVESMLARNLMLMKSIEQQMKPAPRHLAALLNAVMAAEHAYLAVERLAVLADEPGADEIRQNHPAEIKLALSALDKAFAEKAGDAITGFNGKHGLLEWRISELHVAIQSLSEVSTEDQRVSDEFTSAGRLNLLSFLGGLEEIGSLLEPRDRSATSTHSEPVSAEADSEPRPLFDPAAFRFAIKLASAITLGLLVGLTTQRADLQTILWSTVVAGQPNQYGGVVLKTLLRLAGCILGGLLALAAMILVSQNFDSLPPYLVAIFVVMMLSTYVAQSDEWLGYAGIQLGITFLICYDVGLAPTTDIYKPLWRFWGIVLGVLTTAFVFLTLWPEYAGDKLIHALDKLIGTTLEFAKEVAERRITEERIDATERRVSANLLEVLNFAGQARLEGRRGTTNSAAAIESASTLIRIAYRFEFIARRRIAGSELTLQEVLARQESFEAAYCTALEIQLAKLRQSISPERIALSTAASTIDLASMAGDLDTVESADSPPEAQIRLATELETYRRLPNLLQNLDTSLSRIATS